MKVSIGVSVLYAIHLGSGMFLPVLMPSLIEVDSIGSRNAKFLWAEVKWLNIHRVFASSGRCIGGSHDGFTTAAVDLHQPGEPMPDL